MTNKYNESNEKNYIKITKLNKVSMDFFVDIFYDEGITKSFKFLVQEIKLFFKNWKEIERILISNFRDFYESVIL